MNVDGIDGLGIGEKMQDMSTFYSTYEKLITLLYGKIEDSIKK